METKRAGCVFCGRQTPDLMQTAYGDMICEDCWDKYICTDHGKVEYFIGLMSGEYPMSDYDADFLGEVCLSWKKYRDDVELSENMIKRLESTAKTLGLLSDNEV